MSIFISIIVALIVIAAKYLIGVKLKETAECYLPCVIIFCTAVILRRLDLAACKNDEDRKKLSSSIAYYIFHLIICLPVAFISLFIIDSLGSDNAGGAIGIVIAFSVVIAAICTALICKKIEAIKNKGLDDKVEKD